MALLPNLEFTYNSLIVEYRATSTLQDIWIDVQLAEPAVEPLAHDIMSSIVDQINYGAAGGEEFSPTLGHAEIVDGPTHDAIGPSYSWRLRWSGVSPFFLRNVVEKLRICGAPEMPVGMSIRGSLPTDRTNLSVTTERLLQWLDDPTAYPKRFRDVPFSLDEVAACGLSLQIEFVKQITPDVHDNIENLIAVWLEVVQNYVDPSGHPVYESPEEFHFYSGVAKYEYRVRLLEFSHTREPSADSLVNMLLRLHATVAPLVKVEVRL